MQRALALKRFHRPSLYHNHLKTLTSTTTSTQHPFSTTTTTTTTSSSQLPKIKYLACTAGLLFGGAIIYNSFSFPNHNKPQQQPSCYVYNLKLNFEVFSHLIELKRERDEQACNFLKTQIRIYSLELYFAKFGLMEILYRDSLHHIPPCGDAIRQCLEAIDNTQHALLQLDTTMDICMRSSVV
ncbi:hypothetical protein CMV_026631 [Castanea mollissima]|uniref:Uncharacterized protein n=1 Tax=Castanea mollissima TaxID=60419 RepID=A0A8J4Q7M9_9ROSI|nr:hypothetical protein CMV_026631 [Castanea mollissima]